MSKHTITDEEIVAGLQRTDTQNQAFRQLMDKYQERLYMHIRRMVHEYQDANDVLQNTLVKVYKGIKNFKGNAALYTWLYRIATNESITFLKQKKRRRSTSIEDEEGGVAAQLKADSWFDGSEAQRLLKAAIAILPTKQQAVFNMRYYDEMSYQEISDVVGTSVGGLKASYHHAAKKIEQYLKTRL